MKELINLINSNALPAYIVVLTLLMISIIYSIAFFQGRDISIGPLKIGKKLNDNIKSGSKFEKSYLHEIVPENFSIMADEFKNFDELYIMGINLRRLVVSNIDLFKRKLKEGATIKVLLVEPRGSAINLLADRSKVHTDENSMNSSIEVTIENLKELSLTHCKGGIEVRTLNFVPSFSLIIINPNHINGVTRVSLYPYKSAPGSNPGFLLKDKHDTTNYTFFNDQFNKLWASAKSI